MPKKLKVGFDLDGVILYNPIRILRPFAHRFLKPLKAKVLHQKKESFFYPDTPLEKFLWRLIHKTSFRVNNGYDDLKKLAKNKKIELYLITGRYGLLLADYEDWLKKIDAKKVFKKCYINSENLQPDNFKGTMIKKLKLDIYVEDNWDIIEKLNHHTGANILWITNIIDKSIPYPLKFDDLRGVCRFLRKSF